MCNNTKDSIVTSFKESTGNKERILKRRKFFQSKVSELANLFFCSENHVAELYINRLEKLSYFSLNNTVFESIFFEHAVWEAVKLELELEKAKAEATTDPLTGINNRRQFDRELKNFAIRHESDKKPFSLVILDIDDFKSINDTYGHPVGDSVLQVVVREIATHTREGDVFARHGGEEFVLIIPGKMETALMIANRIREGVSKIAFNRLEDATKELRVTISGGVSEFTNQIDDISTSLVTLISLADKALLSAKNSGKNVIFSKKY